MQRDGKNGVLVTMPLRYAVLYLSLGIALGLCLHVTLNMREAGHGEPVFERSSADTALT
jgi:hypothetical protein